ncbi:hypothetical protein V8E51_018131 [Hyaloscypha variabilis]
MDVAKAAASNSVTRKGKRNDAALETAITTSIKSDSAIPSGSAPCSPKWKHSFIEKLTDGAEAMIHVDSALATEVEHSLNDHEDLKSEISVLKLRTTEVAKNLFILDGYCHRSLTHPGRLSWTGQNSNLFVNATIGTPTLTNKLRDVVEQVASQGMSCARLALGLSWL